MPEVAYEERTIIEMPDIDYDSLITEDDEPVDNLFSAKQQRFLVEPLYSSWHPGRPFLADANVGIYNSPYQPAIVPDMFLSLDVQTDEDLWKKENRCYFVWKFGKAPEVVVEIVSNTKGGETGEKFRRCAQIGVWYYIIFDPQQLVQEESLRVYGWSVGQYTLQHNRQLQEVDLNLMLWDGVFEGIQAQWLRWCDPEGKLILTGEEGREQERQRAERLAAQLRAMGIEPDEGY